MGFCEKTINYPPLSPLLGNRRKRKLFEMPTRAAAWGAVCGDRWRPLGALLPCQVGGEPPPTRATAQRAQTRRLRCEASGGPAAALEAVPVTTVPAPTPGLRVLCGRLCWGLGCTDGPRHARGQGPIPARAGPEPSAAPVRTRLVR